MQIQPKIEARLLHVVFYDLR